MKPRHAWAMALLAGWWSVQAPVASWAATVLYSEDFDADATLSWTVNDPGVTDTFADFFFDYSSVGIPAAPNGSGSTRGMMLQANLGNGVFGGFSVSPTDQSFEGDYKLSFDYWGNTHQTPAGAGTSNLSFFGILTSGTFGNYPGVSDGVWFGTVYDGDSSSDFRVYDYHQRQFSYQVPNAPRETDDIPDYDLQATHPLDLFGNQTRNGDASPLMQENFGNVTPPQAMRDLFPNSDLSQSTYAGSMSFAWRRMEIIKEGTMATWVIDGIQVMSLDMSHLPEAPGSNILFGHSDINNGSAPTTSDAFDLLFTLIDNVQVTTLDAEAIPGDFNSDGAVDDADYAVWEAGFGSAYDGSDLLVWQANYGAGAVATGAVPEPAAAGLAALAACLLTGRRRN